MKALFSIAAIFFLFIISNAQSLSISEAEYEKVMQFAVSETNADYPLIFSVNTFIFENGQMVRSITEINENESAGHYRIKRTILADGRETHQYQLTVGFGKVYCSDDGIAWKFSKYGCFNPVVTHGSRKAEKISYSVTTKLLAGEQVKVYRKYSVFAPAAGSKKKEFCDTNASIDSRGFFRTIMEFEGTVEPVTVTLLRMQSWTTKAKIEPIIAPVN